MLRGFYAAASGMLSQQRRTEMLTNNMANANTPGFKADQSTLRSFPEMLLQGSNDVMIPSKNPKAVRNFAPIGSLNTGVYMQETIPNFIQGDMRETGNQTDMALLDGTLPIDPETGKPGSLFFTVQNENGEIRYTRNGNFTLDGQGYLTTNEGYYVLGENNQRIQIPSGQFTVNPDGTILEGNTQAGRLNIAYAANPNTFIKEGNGLFRTEDNNPLPGAAQTADVTYSVKQGFIERSNVDAAQTMTEMMNAYRAFEANQKVLTAYDRSLEKAVNEVGRLR